MQFLRKTDTNDNDLKQQHKIDDKNKNKNEEHPEKKMTVIDTLAVAVVSAAVALISSVKAIQGQYHFPDC